MLYALKNKKRIVMLLALLVALLAFALPALADDAPLSFSLSVEPASLTAPGPVTVSVRVVNNSGADLTEPVSLQDPDGQVVTAFGDGGQALIKNGEYVTAQHTYNVTQAQLSEGKLTYTLSYNQVDESGDVVVQSVARSAEIAYTGTSVDLTVNRTVDPEVVRSGKTANVQYELYNSGNVEITSVTVREHSSISTSPQTVPSLAPGERKTLQFSAPMSGKSLTSAGKVSYKASGESHTVKLPELTIPRANPGLELNDILSADKTAVTSGETVTLTLTIKNNGNITYSNITVNDAKYGELFTNLTLGPGETLVREKQFTLSESTAFKYTVTLPDNTGTTNTVTSNEVKVSVYDPAQVLMLNVVAEADTPTIASAPADVTFTVTVTNNSSFEAKKISLSHGSTAFYTIDKLASGESRSVSRRFSVSQAGKFRFTASAKDALGNNASFDSNEIVLTYAAPVVTATMAPIPTAAPLITLTPAPVEVLEPVKVQTGEALRVAAYVLGGLFAAAFLLFVISTVMRARRRAASKNAYDHMELGDKRDYKEPARHPAAAASSGEEDASAQTGATADLPSDEILKEAAEKAAAAPAETKETPDAPDTADAADTPDASGSYRLTREEGATYVDPTQLPSTEEEPTRRSRRRRRGSDAPSEDE